MTTDDWVLVAIAILLGAAFWWKEWGENIACRREAAERRRRGFEVQITTREER